jgi:hypothetical protein
MYQYYRIFSTLLSFSIVERQVAAVVTGTPPSASSNQKVEFVCV